MDNGGVVGLIDQLSQWIGSAATALLAGLAGRMMYHAQEVEKKNRKFFGWELLWELPTSFGMALIGEALVSFLQLPYTVGVGMIGVISLLGPRWIETVATPLMSKITEKFGSK